MKQYIIGLLIVSAAYPSFCKNPPTNQSPVPTQNEPVKEAVDPRSYYRRVGEEIIGNIPQFLGMMALMYTAEAALCITKKQPYTANHTRNIAHAALITPLMNRFAFLPGLFMIKESASKISDAASTKQLVVPLIYGLSSYALSGLGAIALTGDIVGWKMNASVSKKLLGAALVANILIPALVVKIDEWSKKSLNVMDVLEDEGLFSKDPQPDITHNNQLS